MSISNNILYYKIQGINLIKYQFNLENNLMLNYNDFWRNMYYNDSYINYKNSILFLKNNYNNSGFSYFINSLLWNGKCISDNYNNESAKEFIHNNNNSFNIPNVESLCRLAVNFINSLDEMFIYKCPKLNDHMTVFRSETLSLSKENLKDILNIKKGDKLRKLNYLSTSINFSYPLFFLSTGTYHDKKISLKELNKKNNTLLVYYYIELPKNTKGYYMNIPFEIDENNYGRNEYEFVLPRGCLFEILDVKKMDYLYIIHMKLTHQLNKYEPIKDDIDNKNLKIVYNEFPEEYLDVNKFKNLNKYHKKSYKMNKFIVSYVKNNINGINKIVKILYSKNKLISLLDNNKRYYIDLYDLFDYDNLKKNKIIEININSSRLFNLKITSNISNIIIKNNKNIIKNYKKTNNKINLKRDYVFFDKNDFTFNIFQISNIEELNKIYKSYKVWKETYLLLKNNENDFILKFKIKNININYLTDKIRLKIFDVELK
jgi:hypothetical protein